jgi:predicted DNA-binding protein
VTLLVDLRRRLAATAQREGITHSQLALEAVDAHPLRTRDDAWATPTDRLAPPRRSPRDTDGMAPTTLYLDDARLVALDRLAQHAGMSRSELVRSALQAHLPP